MCLGTSSCVLCREIVLSLECPLLREGGGGGGFCCTYVVVNNTAYTCVLMCTCICM